VVNESFGHLSDLMSFISHCPLVAAAVACAADWRHSCTAFSNPLSDGLDKMGSGCLSHAVLAAMMHNG